MNDERTHQDQQRAHLYRMVKGAFPAEKYTGVVTQYDSGPWAEELDEEKALFETLKDKTWLDTSPDFLKAYPDGYLLLTPHAYTAFIAAWLRYSLERMQGENQGSRISDLYVQSAWAWLEGPVAAQSRTTCNRPCSYVRVRKSRTKWLH